MVSVSESITSSTSKTKSGNDLALTKKKLKVLKQALVDEKNKSEDKDKKLLEATKEIEKMKSILAEKDKKYDKLLQDKTNLEDSLMRNPLKAKKQDSVSSDQL